jgi:DNA-binding NarL/FixJ family response regulator
MPVPATISPSPRAASNPLTACDFEVLHLLRKGMTNPDIGRLLGITPRTAKAHITAILEKLEAADRAEAVARAFERGLLKGEGSDWPDGQWLNWRKRVRMCVAN